MKYLIIMCAVCLCSCGTSKKVTTEKIYTEIKYVDTVQRVALPQLTNTIKLPNVCLDTVIVSDNVIVKVKVTGEDIDITTQLTDSVDVVTTKQIITTSHIKSTKTTKRSNSVYYFTLILLLMIIFRISK